MKSTSLGTPSLKKFLGTTSSFQMQYTEGFPQGRQSQPLGFLLEFWRDSLSALELITVTVCHLPLVTFEWKGGEGSH